MPPHPPAQVIDFPTRTEMREHVREELDEFEKTINIRFGYIEKSIDAIHGYGKTLVVGVFSAVGLAMLNLIFKH